MGRLYRKLIDARAILLSLNLLMLLIGCCMGTGLNLPRRQITTLAIESGFQNGTIGIVVGTLISKPVANAALSQPAYRQLCMAC